ncbi:replicative DNA helicase [Gracilibacillus saliphilus]|uniref:replicative DNA helicase n=1 Tax=Gracilibacillus saliphilus TaxID=543890 RepID=UPI0013D3C71B|nr:DnaB-like helicase C-terminal domain-containing protein [Gracilibacillus saliphilus]
MSRELLERQILGCLLKDNTLIEETNITPSMLEVEVHQVLFDSMIKIFKSGKVVDQVTLLSSSYQQLNKIGGIDFINKLKTDGDPTNFESYEQTFLDELRKSKANKLLESFLSSQDKDINHLMLNLEKIVDQGTDQEQNVKDVLVELYEEPHLEQSSQNMIPTGIKSLDRLILGFEKKTSTIIGARPSIGKTAFILKLSKSAAKLGFVPCIFSLEMNKKSLLRRMISTEANINGLLAKQSNKLTDHQKKAWSNAIGEIDTYNLEIFDNSMKTTQDMRSDIRKVMKKHPGKQLIVFIDYLTKIQTKDRFNNEHMRVTEISDQLKAIAKDYDLPVVTLAQLSRNVEQRQDKRPGLSDLRESGSIEQDGDLIMFLYRDDYYDAETEKQNILEVIVAKARDGAVGTVDLYYNKSTGIIADLEERYESGRVAAGSN